MNWKKETSWAVLTAEKSEKDVREMWGHSCGRGWEAKVRPSSLSWMDVMCYFLFFIPSSPPLFIWMIFSVSWLALLNIILTTHYIHFLLLTPSIESTFTISLRRAILMPVSMNYSVLTTQHFSNPNLHSLSHSFSVIVQVSDVYVLGSRLDLAILIHPSLLYVFHRVISKLQLHFHPSVPLSVCDSREILSQDSRFPFSHSLYQSASLSFSSKLSLSFPSCIYFTNNKEITIHWKEFSLSGTSSSHLH